MKSELKKLLIKSKPTLREVLLLTLVVSILVLASHMIWGRAITTYIWLFGLSVWLLFHIRKERAIHERMDEIDLRDMEYHDYYERKVQELQDELREIKSISQSKEE